MKRSKRVFNPKGAAQLILGIFGVSSFLLNHTHSLIMFIKYDERRKKVYIHHTDKVFLPPKQLISTTITSLQNATPP